MIDLKRLRELAMRCTPGPWHEGTWPDVIADDARETIVCEATGGPANEVARADRTFIASANPQTVLALLDALEAAQRDAKRLRGLREFLPEQMAKIESAFDCGYV